MKEVATRHKCTTTYTRRCEGPHHSNRSAVTMVTPTSVVIMADPGGRGAGGDPGGVQWAYCRLCCWPMLSVPGILRMR